MTHKFAAVLTMAALSVAFVAPALAQQPLPPPAQGQPASRGFEFGLIGDIGYTRTQDAAFKRLIDHLNAASALAFVAHDGDLWGPDYGGCTDENYASRLALFQTSVHPLIFTPGDNDWVDCWDERFGGYDPLGRLALVRTLFFADQFSLGRRTLPLARQLDNPNAGAHPENARWDIGEITFLTIHTTGSNNNLGISAEGDVEHAARAAANTAWLRQGFGHARTRGSKGLMVITQANPGFERPRDERAAFNDVLDTLEEETLAFARPVVFVHGDTHCFRVNKPLMGSISGRRIETFTRVETFGTPDHHWVHVTVDPRDPNVFTFRQRIVDENVPDHNQPQPADGPAPRNC